MVAHVSTSSLLMADSYFTVCRYQILFIHCLWDISPPPLAAVNYAACLYKYLFESLLSILIYLGVELLGHIVIIFLRKNYFFICLVCAGSLLLHGFSVESLLSSLIYLGVELLGHIVIIFFNKKITSLFVWFVLGLCCCTGFL